MEEKNTQLSVLDNAREKFILACSKAQSLQLVNDFGSAFIAAGVVKTLREVLTDEVMEEVFMPLMNTKIGFLTDRSMSAKKPKTPYTIPVVRDSIIDAVGMGLHPTGNQFNIIAEKMYPTKEGYTFLLRKLNCKYIITKGYDKTPANSPYAEISTTINFEENGKRQSLTLNHMIKKNDYTSHDQLQGKAEKKSKKALYEYLTGHDLGDGDIEGGTIDIPHVDMTGDEKKANLKNKVSNKVDLP